MLNKIDWVKLSLIALSCFACPLKAQIHFSFTSNTGNNMTVLLRSAINPTLNGFPLSKGDEIGVFSSSGLCVGAIIWQDTNITITVWGDNELTTNTDGITPNDTLRYRVWDVANSREISAKIAYSLSGPVYSVDGVAILSSFSADLPNGVLRYAGIQHNRIERTKSFTLYDIQGKLVFRSSCAEYDDLFSYLENHNPGLSSSQYIVKLESFGINYYSKISIDHNSKKWTKPGE